MIDERQNLAVAPTPFAPSRLLKDVGFGFLTAFELSEKEFKKWQAKTRRSNKVVVWADEKRLEDGGLADFAIAEAFLTSKQLFLRGGRAIPSYPPVRAFLGTKQIIVNMAAEELPFKFNFIISHFAKQGLLTVFSYTSLPAIPIDFLIYLKESKWHGTADQTHGWSWIGDKGERVTATSYSGLLSRMLSSLRLNPLHDGNYPIFDFIELSDVGPGTGEGPNLEQRLTVQEHWGLLCGDEGYRLLCPSEKMYETYIVNPENRQRGREVFLYNFSTTSCLAFVATNRAERRRAWQIYYRDHVAYSKRLDDYLTFSPQVPGLTDGIPLVVEVCMLRYVELTRIDRELEKEGRSFITSLLLARLGGLTAIERAVTLMQNLDLYQESSLWISGGVYANQLFGYSMIRNRIDRRLEHVRFASSDVRLFYLSLLSLLAAVAAVTVTLL